MAEAKTVPVLFVSEPIVLPGMVVPIELDDAARAAVDAARASESGELLIAPRLDDRYPSYGVLATIVQIGRMVGGPAAVVRGGSRAHIGAGATGPGAALWVEVTEVEETAATEDTYQLAAEYKKLLLAMLQRREAWQIIDFVNQLSDPSALADTAGYASYLTQVQKRQLLETPEVAERLRALIEWTGDQLAEVEVSEKIAEDVREGLEKTQKEFLLRQQLNAIRKELGDDDGTGSSDDYRSRVEAADLPEKVREAALREVGKLERAGDQSPESGWIRTWLDTVLDLPWNVHTDDSTDLAAARGILDADHHGLDDVKDRIVEYLAVRARRAQRGLQVVGGRGSGAVMVLAGPPGVGKTSLGESVARALGRKFVRVALGGVRDEAEIRGHRRTYVGALPGRIVRAIGEAGSMNPVVLLDEIDKVGSDFRGDPAAALLEVLDPAQNHTFRDHYLDLDLDLSDVVFLATANVIENIPSALLDRMELVQIDGYTEDDKVAIARDFLLPRQRERAALTDDEVTVTEAALRKVAADYTREPGVRQFERLLAKAMRKVTTKLAAEPGPITIDEPDLVGYLGRPRFLPESAERTAVPGVATGLAVTGLGGDVLYIEAGATDGEPSLQLTGQLGEVMKESAQIALSYVRSHAEQLGVDPAVLDRRIHVHVPAGAVPKDGPSAGVTMVTALVSMATGRQVRSDVGMTGEVTLNGRVLPIGGVKQKLLAAQRAGLSTVFIPQRNEADLDDVPADVLEALEVKPMTDVADIVAQALAPVEETATAAA
ncbi:endopeptidase La [Mycolicibacterium flavescens]|uniref:Lon protease n=1 Tax=Mycolicibacterium flavescens TaxID=1776 RepID=A0A1E3RKY9_MYCFV|nr:endopeptidase La [Mycolicibacterium flavescens]MCV7279060.1 endopeptidase La [Mycolicibacterium flavescens]ODQ90545.1 endopeptidase La [Mycolicibacterium flavescens]